ncbi:MAG: SBBP repeat-containing protein, partial [Acidiferrobacterales bacterium]
TSGGVRADTYGHSVATDSSGNVYVAGDTAGGLDGNTLTGATDFFLTEYNAAGTKIYTKQLGVARADTYGRSVATDSSGNVYVAGVTSGGLDGNTLTGTEDFFVTRYNTAGVHN